VIRQRGIEPSDRPLLAALLQSLTAFSDDERTVALELIDHRLAHPGSDDYRFILSFSSTEDGPEDLAGYICYGRTPMTRSTYDLYWIGTSPSHARSGVARGLVASLERDVAGEGGGLVRVETGSREGVHFYDALGFSRTATIADFYAPGDDLIIFTKRIQPGDARAGERPGASTGAEVDAREHAEAALYDAAFGYRDFAAERDFLLDCARRFGEREVRRVLAWSCGAGRHLNAFAAGGVEGIGTDPSAAMIAYAQRLAGAPGTRFVRAALDERPRADPPIAPVDLSFVLLSSIHLLTTPEAMERHLSVAAELLNPGGVHVIEATHPADLTPSGVNHTEWTEARGDTTVDARFRMHVERMTTERVVPVTLEVARTTGKKSAGNGAPRLKQEDRWFIPDVEGWRAIVARIPELSLVATLGGFSVATPYDHAAAWRLILVLEKVARGAGWRSCEQAV
jgi:ribosomal protein S18 acetylase RimI-like enzyme